MVRAAPRGPGARRVPGDPAAAPRLRRGPPPAGHLTIGDHARACAALLRELGVERAHWVGHSSSCCMGLQLALDAPELVAGLILYEPAQPAGPLRDELVPRFVRPALAAARAGDTATAFDLFLAGMGGEGYREGLRERLGDDGIAAAVRESAFFFTDEFPALRAWDFGPAEGTRITAPTCVVAGTGTRPWFREDVELLAAMVPGAEAVTLPGLDHMAPLTHPHELGVLIARAVRSGTSASAPAEPAPRR
ncbi:alpha/beta hydrolase [Pseudonocardia sp. NPDC049154]|uniref:alpha/beta fold hydrolase n=1 Tax=Pseudonocardia sp. NPDC049154 TaxID=3155501 RepID=UPI0033D6252C